MKTITTLNAFGINPKTKLLVIVPHPDDEAVFAAGFIYQSALLNADITVMCITNGDHSTLRFGVQPGQDLGKLRQQEFNRACQMMRASRMVCANVQDGTIETNFRVIAKFIANELVEYRPTHVLTLEPDGIYGHPDHIALTRVITVMHQSRSLGFRLIYATVPSLFTPGEGARNLAKRQDIQPIRPTHQLKLSLQAQYIKIHTCMCHYSQLGENQEFWDKWHQYGMLENEYLHLVHRRP